MSVLLGYDSYSEKVLEDRMAHDPLTVQKFENDLINKIQGKAKEETLMLQQLKREQEKN